MKECVLILGMHRSGTSAITGIMQKLGYDLGGELLPNAEDNSKGFFENVRVKEYNDIVLDKNKSRYDDTRHDVTIKFENVKTYVKKATAIINEDFRSENKIAIKDPSLCLTFPIWQKALNLLGFKQKVIIIYRNPLEVAQSLEKRNGYDLEKSLHLWSKYFFYSENYSRECDRMFISFDMLINNMPESLNKICNFLEITKIDDQKIHGFIDKSLKHNNIDIAAIDTNLPYHIIEIIKLMSSDSLANLSFDEFDRLREEYYQYSKKCTHIKPKTIKLSKKIKKAIRGY